jgi:ribose 5-phosphate isomerase B
MRVGIAVDQDGFPLKQELIAKLREAGHAVTMYGLHRPEPVDDYPDCVIPLARAVAAGHVERGIVICSSGVGACVCANKVSGVRAGLIRDRFAARQGVEDDHLNVICLDGCEVHPTVAWNLIKTFLAAQFSSADRHLRRLGKVALLEVTVAG